MRQTTLSREDFITALVSLCGGDNPAFDPDQDAQARLPPHLITAEVALHELCHVVSLGLDWEKLEKIATHNGRRPAPAQARREAQPLLGPPHDQLGLRQVGCCHAHAA